jgi:hypothetical protein
LSFYVNYGYHSRCTLKITSSNDYRTENSTTEHLIEKLKTIHFDLKENLHVAQVVYKAQYDKHIKEIPPYKVDDMIWLSRKNINTTRPTKKFDYRQLGPYKILEVIRESKLAFRLELPHQMKIHPVFHASLLHPHRPNTIPGRTQPSPPHVEIQSHEEYEVKEILDSRIRRNKLEYYVDWEGYLPSERTWEPAEDVCNAADAVKDFHTRNPHRAALTDVKQPQRQTRPSRQTRRSSS